MNDNLKCCICGEPAPATNIMGRRAYCDRHWAQVNKHHIGFWRAGILQIVLMGVFSAVVAVIANNLRDLNQVTLISVGLLLALVPTALWFYYFYSQDRLEPEPKTKLSGVFILALLMTDVAGRWLLDALFQIRVWSPTNSVVSLLASILIIGFTYEGIKYAAVRGLVYATDEFDERMDGLVYGTTAGLGVATLLNFHHILDNQGVALAPGVIHVVTTALAQASFGGLTGYFMAQAKFEHRPAWWVPAGLSLAAVLNGLFSWLIEEVSANGLEVDPWRSLIFGLIVALGTFLVLIALMRRATALTLEATTN
ncbi:MAG: PrsW family glutamic-type intramembrane protease [Chloroflexota bacterium]